MSLFLRSTRAPPGTFSLKRILTLFIIATRNHYTSTAAFIMKGRSSSRLFSSSVIPVDKEEEISKMTKLKKEIVPIENIGELDESFSSTQKMLLDVGDLIPMVVVQRPSAAIKTPYIADLIFKPEDYSISNFIFEVPNNESTSNSSSSSIVSLTASKKPSKKSLADKKKAATVSLSNALRATVSEEGILSLFEICSSLLIYSLPLLLLSMLVLDCCYHHRYNHCKRYSFWSYSSFGLCRDDRSRSNCLLYAQYW
jgi:hypothetical protein